MSICTFVYEFINGWSYLSLASKEYFGILNENYDKQYCVLKGIIEQFFESASVTWDFILALTLFRIVFFNEDINETIKFYHIFVGFVAFVTCIVIQMDQIMNVGLLMVHINYVYMDHYYFISYFQMWL